MENNYSLSDLAAVTGGNGFGMGGNGGGLLFLIVLFLLVGGNGFNRGDYGQYASAASQQEILFGQSFQNLDNKLDRLGFGLADSTYALNNSITNEGRGIQMQIADCCCGNKEAVAQVRYDMANFAAATNANVTAQTQKILDAMSQNKIDSLQSQVSELKMQSMFCGLPRINPYGYGVYAYTNPVGNCPCNNV